MINEKPIHIFAKSLRNKSTLGEVILWDKVLKNKKMKGFQFNRQFPIDDYIVDFICRRLKLIIEIDGYSHKLKYNQDIIRENKLKNMGYSILRFSEPQVRNDLQNVIRSIENFLEQINPPAPFSKGELHSIN
jgi:very-short-patch-repair endonuclease